MLEYLENFVANLIVSLISSEGTYHITKEYCIKFTMKAMTTKNISRLVTIYKVTEISSAHQLSLPYESKCNKLHGHNFKIEVWVTGFVNEYGMVLDFNKMKHEIMKFDHQNLNDFLEVPTAENLAIEISRSIIKLSQEGIKTVKTRVWETHSAYAETVLNS